MAEIQRKIALLGPAPPFRGGITQFALMLAKEWLRQGKEVRMFTFERQYPKLLFPGGGQTTEFSDLPDIAVERVFTPYQPGSWKNAVKRIQAWQPDAVIASYFLPWFAPSYAWICRRLQDTRVICLAHNVDFHEKWPGADILSRRLFRSCDKIVVLSEACLRDLKRKFPESISTKGVLGFHPIYDCYARTEDASATAESNTLTAMFFGLIKPYKGLDILLKAVKQARLRIPELKLLIAGEVYGNEEMYQKQIRSLGLEDAVETHFRYITDTEVSGFFQRCQVCVLPYKSATQSGVIATAYSFDVPVIASNVGGLSEYISENETGLLVAPNDPEALAAALIRYYEHGLFGKFSARIPTYRKRFSWAKLAELMLDN